MEAGDECPNCHCGTLEETDEEFVCRGECGEVWEKSSQEQKEMIDGTSTPLLWGRLWGTHALANDCGLRFGGRFVDKK